MGTQSTKVKKFKLAAINPLTPRVKPWAIQTFSAFDSMGTTIKCDHSLESCIAVLSAVFQFYPVCNFGKLSFLDLALSLECEKNLSANVQVRKNTLFMRTLQALVRCTLGESQTTCHSFLRTIV